MREGSQERRLCVVTPCFNEELVVEKFYYELKRALATLDGIKASVLFVDDGSTDRTLEALNRLAAEDSAVEVLSLTRNFGHQIAITAGLDYVDADAVVVM